MTEPSRRQFLGAAAALAATGAAAPEAAAESKEESCSSSVPAESGSSVSFTTDYYDKDSSGVIVRSVKHPPNDDPVWVAEMNINAGPFSALVTVDAAALDELLEALRKAYSTTGESKIDSGNVGTWYEGTMTQGSPSLSVRGFNQDDSYPASLRVGTKYGQFSASFTDSRLREVVESLETARSAEVYDE